VVKAKIQGLLGRRVRGGRMGWPGDAHLAGMRAVMAKSGEAPATRAATPSAVCHGSWATGRPATEARNRPTTRSQLARSAPVTIAPAVHARPAMPARLRHRSARAMPESSTSPRAPLQGRSTASSAAGWVRSVPCRVKAGKRGSSVHSAAVAASSCRGKPSSRWRRCSRGRARLLKAARNAGCRAHGRRFSPRSTATAATSTTRARAPITWTSSRRPAMRMSAVTKSRRQAQRRARGSGAGGPLRSDIAIRPPSAAAAMAPSL